MISVSYRNDTRFRSDSGLETRYPIDNPIFIGSDQMRCKFRFRCVKRSARRKHDGNTGDTLREDLSTNHSLLMAQLEHSTLASATTKKISHISLPQSRALWPPYSCASRHGNSSPRGDDFMLDNRNNPTCFFLLFKSNQQLM